MGYFQAYRASDDQPVKFENKEILDGMANGSTQPGDYYKAILKKTFGENVVDSSEKLKISSWGLEGNFSKLISFGKTPTGAFCGIKKIKYLSYDQAMILDKLHDAEFEYYWRWLENGREVVNEQNEKILNWLRIETVKELFNYFDTTNFSRSSNNQGYKTVDLGKPVYTFIPCPLVISRIEIKKSFPVALIDNANLSFMDYEEATSRYYYKKVMDGGKELYKIQPTYVYDDMDFVYGYTHSVGERRSALKFQQYMSDFPESRKCFSIFLQAGKALNSAKQEELKKSKLEGMLNDAVPDRKDIAERFSKQLPNTKGRTYYCSYFDNQGTLNGFVNGSSASGRKGRGSGYVMRADKIEEVEYQWTTLNNGTTLNDEDKLTSRLWAYIFGLGGEVKNVSVKQKDGDNGFYPTNWLREGSGNAKSLIQYYKKFKDSPEGKRNKPDTGIPFPPRITNSGITGYKYSYSLKDTNNANVKLNKVQYRVWKKENTLENSQGDRLDAGPTMAKELKSFSVFSDMVKGDFATNSSLPATGFARYILKNDDEAQKQWKSDIFDKNVSVNDTSLRTDQEWCHLLGHGDGGTEELGNFVSGSKHCNTEQLAIETGQRKVTQSEYFNSMKVKIKARITAYLMPNGGTWVEGKAYSKEGGKDPSLDLNELLGDNFDTGYSCKDSTGAYVNVNVLNDFFELNADGAYILKNKDSLKTSYENLSKGVRFSKDDDKKALFQLRHNIDRHFFMYLPLARWMRYKLYYKNNKVFDHIYDAQSESMNIHECQILDFMVEKVLYDAIASGSGSGEQIKSHYKEKLVERMAKKVPDEKGIELVKKIIEWNNELIKNINNQGTVDVGKTDALRAEVTAYQKKDSFLSNILSEVLPQIVSSGSSLSKNAKRKLDAAAAATSANKKAKKMADGSP